ncbi:hypothetical protein QSH57_004802 [Fusarium oxysporum f. sp. vasinfectum]|nr:hypothetical protein QSH57_004802 [Fusarium oxysporum f. sp. vasinfectum]
MPTGLTPLYERIMRHIQQLQPEDSEFCRLVISVAIVASRPLRLFELGLLSGLPRKVSDGLRSVVDMCASFLMIRDDYDTSFQIQRASKSGIVAGQTTLTVQDLHDAERLAAYLTKVCGLPKDDCLVALKEADTQLFSIRAEFEQTLPSSRARAATTREQRRVKSETASLLQGSPVYLNTHSLR